MNTNVVHHKNNPCSRGSVTRMTRIASIDAEGGRCGGPQARKLFPALHEHFGAAYGGEDRAKRLRVNVAKAASTAREILALLANKPNVPETEKVFLQDVAGFFSAMNELFQDAQKDARHAKAKAGA